MYYKKKPVVIQALQLKGDDASIFQVLKFMGELEGYDETCKFNRDAVHSHIDDIKKNGLKIDTLEGVMSADIDDYIIKGVKGEFYPCKPDIFVLTYENVKGGE